ncbi:it plays a direct role in the translocation of protons across the membrane [Vibrio sp. B1FLJ16]|uniref:F0F1 ATP synthase subunit A n=1 Tax=Vibrio sp. B1FLJ16 TaxID=2751178 RepID=UPI0015F6C9F5|nr:F0F1 ATP synthase subunit A [Vibrio sp. B1FLJ16]CAD7820007.1 it plays a direct role in the translocation of protons across the membrane [Vibrio sp. B1FLJ16]CAE6941414.1 it plays a direct role in the translocation of protons across the membrane [Vibrio sp. B1FLJ16]
MIDNTVVTTWGIMFVIGLLAWLLSRNLCIKPGLVQTAVEGIISSIENVIKEVAPQHVNRLIPFIGSLWIFLVIANLSGLIPGVHSPTRDLSATSALAIVVFLSSHWFGISLLGVKRYLSHYLKPSPILLPFHLIGEVTRTIALAVRLFGNMMSLEMAALLFLMVAGFLAPVPILMLHVIEALVQAYIFGMLALIYIAGSLQYQQQQQEGDTNA